MKTTSQKNTKNTVETKRKTLRGVVVSDKMKDTVVVLVERYIKHPKYQKFIQRRKRFQAHNPGNTAKTGDKVVIEETRPMSKHKHFIVLDITKNPAAAALTE
jgi:small subunit ribosomal protein S17